MVKLIRIFDSLLENTIVTLYSAIILVISIQILLRYGFATSLVWSEEFGRYSFIWMTWLGGAYAIPAGLHLGFDLLILELHAKIRMVCEIVARIVIILFLLTLIIYGIKVMALTMETASPSLQIPMGLMHLSTVIGSIAMIIQTLRKPRPTN